MKNIRIFTLLTAVTLGAAFTATARADDWDKMSKLTFSQPVMVGSTLLQPGTYTFKLVNLASDRHTVQIMNERQNHVVATIEAINTWRDTPTGKTVVTFYETPAGQPQAVKDWFYPGDNDGQEFTNKSRAVEFSQVAPAAPAPPPPAVAEAAPAPAPEPAPPVIAQNEPPAAAPPAPQAAPEPAPETPAPQVLPKTASDIPLLTLVGLLSLGAAAGLGTIVKKVG